MKDSFKFLGVTYWPASDEITGRNGLKVPRKVLTNMLDDGEIKEFQKTIAGLNPDYATVPETVDPPVEVEPDS